MPARMPVLSPMTRHRRVIMKGMEIQSNVIPGTELTVPNLTVGTMMFGKRADESESRKIVDAALDRGLPG
jgi:hypothetical protein